ncbi:hypothetical protein B0H19DRAFT_1303954 [Mycena capillaripes]|nr:hypothetical protein B0H19DRAFT_1303954 [Mycena capillaripes]
MHAHPTSKRPRVDSLANKENQHATQATKKARLEVAAPVSNPYKTLPPPTSSFIQLRFQLARFKGVYRVARIPLNYSFANLYKLVLFMFGWSGDHAHRASVYSHVEMYSGNYKAYHMKKIQFFWRLCGQCGAAGRGSGPVPFAGVEPVRRNASKGACGNKEIGVIYEYDLGGSFLFLLELVTDTYNIAGASWEIHITMDRDNDFFTVQPASNLPIIVVGKNKGAPPIEDAHGEVFGELDGRQKDILSIFYDDDVFKRYLNGEVSSIASRTALKARKVASAADPRAAIHAGDEDEYGSMGGSSSEGDEEMGSDGGEDDEGMGSDSGDSDEEEHSQTTSDADNRFALAPRARTSLPVTQASTRARAPEMYDDLQDADGEYEQDEDDDDDEIDDETLEAIAMCTMLIMQQQTAGAMMILTHLRQHGRI